MKTNRVSLCVSFFIVFLLIGCVGKNKSKKEDKYTGDPIYSMTTIVAPEENENELPPPPVRFTPPVLSGDEEKFEISIADVVGCDERVAVDYVELKKSKVIVDEAAPLSSPIIVVQRQIPESNTEEYASFVENKFKVTLDDPLSTFSVDVDGAAYSNVRRFINQGSLPNADAVRIEEMINYFSYKYPEPRGNDPVHISTEVGTCPWNKQHRLVKVGLKAKEVELSELPASSFVFLIDVSGSMSGPTRIDLVKSSMKLLLNELRPDDKVAIVTYASGVSTRLKSTPAKEKDKIMGVIDGLIARGATSGGDGIIRAYKEAEANYIKGGNNRIILCTDGDFNVGVSSDDELEKLIEKKREGGVFLSVLGYGMGNYKDRKMQVLAQAGNGNHAYIDNLQEAQKVLVTEFGGTMFTVAKDVKLQLEFNPDKVQAYRLVGYETRHLNKEDFNDDTKDAGEMGVGHTVTAFYEVIPVGVKSSMVPSVDDLKYQKEKNKKKSKKDKKTESAEMLTVKLRYKEPDGDVSKKIEKTLVDNKKDDVSGDFNFAASVAMYGQLLRNSQYKANADYDMVIALAKKGLENDEDGYRREFVRLVETTKGLSK